MWRRKVVIKRFATCLPMALAALGVLTVQAAEAQSQEAAGTKWKLTWSDEFDGTKGSPVDPAKWVVETGGGGWGNNELEYYTARLKNLYQQDGKLVIKVLREEYTGANGIRRDYTSARLKTLGKFSQKYGRF